MKVTRQTHNIELYRGDNVHEELAVVGVDVDSTGLVYDLTGCTGQAQIRRVVDGPIVLELTVTVTDAANGLIVATSDEPVGDVNLGPDGEGVFDVQILSPDATPLVYTSHRGTVTFVKDVTVE